MPADQSLTMLTACQAVDLLRAGDVSPLELLDASLARHEAIDGAVNAMPTICAERARDHARRIIDTGAPDSVEEGGVWLGGLPIAVKDLQAVAGVRTTYGSPIYGDHIPDRSDLAVERLEERGAIIVGKSNTPEFGAGANTFNEVFGKTRNPWNTALTCGGSSGGSAVALATGQTWLATGSDLGGSLRIPASYCSVVGLRPSPGRVARGPAEIPFDVLSVEGPLGRTVGDVALMLDAMSGWHAADPISLPAPDKSFTAGLDGSIPPRRVAFGRDLGFMPVEDEVADICAAACRNFEAMGAAVEEASLDFSDAPEIFQILRAALFTARFAPLFAERREDLKPEMVWNIEKGLALTADEIGRAERARATMYATVSRFFQDVDLLLCPAVAVPPFDVDTRYVTEVAGQSFDNYVDWLGFTYAISLIACPAISVPCGFTDGGLPIGLQMVGRPRGEAELLMFASLFEDAAGINAFASLPIEPK